MGLRRSGGRGAAAALAALALGASAPPLAECLRVAEMDPIDALLVVPKLKFAFCFIPKNACTQFNKLMNFLNGLDEHLGEVCTDADPNFVSRWRSMNYTRMDLDRIMAGEEAGWTRAVFLRDPLERLVSAWRSKCSYPRECGGCPGARNAHKCEVLRQTGSNCLPSFEDVILKHLSSTKNVHFLPQSGFCGGFSRGDISQRFDFVGHLSGDFASNSRQVRSLLASVLRRDPLVARRALDRLPAGGNGGLVRISAGGDGSGSASQLQSGSSEVVADHAAEELTRAFFVPDSVSDATEPYFTGSSSTHKAAVSVAESYFPSAGPTATAHINSLAKANVSAYYTAPEALHLARDYYREDFELPGLKLPEWAGE